MKFQRDFFDLQGGAHASGFRVCSAISGAVRDRVSVTINHQYEVMYGLTIATELDDLGWRCFRIV